MKQEKTKIKLNQLLTTISEAMSALFETLPSNPSFQSGQDHPLIKSKS
jgi:hypothetical protein